MECFERSLDYRWTDSLDLSNQLYRTNSNYMLNQNMWIEPILLIWFDLPKFATFYIPEKKNEKINQLISLA